MVRLLADEQFSARIVYWLQRACGHDVLTIQQTNLSKYGDGKTDELVLDIAMHEQRAVLTENRKHFRLLHETTHWHWGIVSLKRSDDQRKDARLIDDKIKRCLTVAHNLRGQYVRVPPISISSD